VGSGQWTEDGKRREAKKRGEEEESEDEDEDEDEKTSE